MDLSSRRLGRISLGALALAVLSPLLLLLANALADGFLFRLLPFRAHLFVLGTMFALALASFAAAVLVLQRGLGPNGLKGPWPPGAIPALVGVAGSGLLLLIVTVLFNAFA